MSEERQIIVLPPTVYDELEKAGALNDSYVWSRMPEVSVYGDGLLKRMLIESLADEEST